MMSYDVQTANGTNMHLLDRLLRTGRGEIVFQCALRNKFKLPPAFMTRAFSMGHVRLDCACDEVCSDVLFVTEAVGRLGRNLKFASAALCNDCEIGAVHGELRGNRTPAAEANFAGDPEAAQTVLEAGFGRLVLADLGVTHQTDVIPIRKALRKELPHSVITSFIWEMSQTFIDCYTKTFGAKVAPCHDVVAIMYLLRPEIFTAKPARVEVELSGTLTRGMSVADWKGEWKKAHNCEVLLTLNFERFVEEFVKGMRALSIR